MNEDLKKLVEVASGIVAIVEVIQAFVFLYNFSFFLFWVILIGSGVVIILLFVKMHEESEITEFLVFLALIALGTLDIIYSIYLMIQSNPLWIITQFITIPLIGIGLYSLSKDNTFGMALCVCNLAIMITIQLPSVIAVKAIVAS